MVSLNFNLDKHISITSHNEIHAICKEFFRMSICDHFSYFREYQDRSRIYLCTNPEWTIYYFNQKYPDVSNFESILENYMVNGWYTWSALAEVLLTKKETETFYQKLSDINNFFSIKSGISRAETHVTFVEYFILGSTDGSKQVIDDYLCHQELYNSFIDYFKQEAQKIIEKADKSRIVLPSTYKKDRLVIHEYFPEHLKATSFPIKKYYLTGQFRNVALSYMQYWCSYYLSIGNSMKEIGKLMNISSRTVETHLNSVKQKTGLVTNSQIKKLPSRY